MRGKKSRGETQHRSKKNEIIESYTFNREVWTIGLHQIELHMVEIKRYEEKESALLGLNFWMKHF